MTSESQKIYKKEKAKVLKNGLGYVIFLFCSMMSQNKHFMILDSIIWFSFLVFEKYFDWKIGGFHFLLVFDWVVLGALEFPIFVHWPTGFFVPAITNNNIDSTCGRWPTKPFCNCVILLKGYCNFRNMSIMNKFIWATSPPSLVMWRTTIIFFCIGITSIQSSILTRAYPPVAKLLMPPHTLSIPLINWSVAFKWVNQFIEVINSIVFRWHVYYFNFAWVYIFAITKFNRIFIGQNWIVDSFTITIINLRVWNIFIATLLLSMLKTFSFFNHARDNQNSFQAWQTFSAKYTIGGNIRSVLVQ